MKSFILITIAILIGFSCAFEPFKHNISDAEIFGQFQNFTETYSKKYTTIEETKERFEIFKQNYIRITVARNMHLKLNLEVSHQEGVTQFFDMTPKEFSKIYLNLDINILKRLQAKYSDNTIKINENLGELPENLDWRDKNVVSPVKNQGSCGSCWAFSAIGNIEAMYKMKTNKDVLLSEQQLVDCDKEKDHGCNGGLMDHAYTYLNKTGVMSSKDYPYSGRDGTCKFNQTQVVAKVTGFRFANGKKDTVDENDLKALIFQNGPFAIAINASPLQFYLGGILNPWEFLCNPKAIDHGVLLVGYGVENGKAYWIVKNSWGSGWGEKGYFRIISGKGACGLNTYVVTAEVSDI